MGEIDTVNASGLNIVETTEGGTLSYREESGVRLYRGMGDLRRLAQEFDPTSFQSPYGSGYGDPAIEFKLAPLAVVGGTGRYYGLDTDGLNTYLKALGGLFPVVRGEELPDTVRVQLNNGTFVYFPTSALLEKFHIQKRT